MERSDRDAPAPSGAAPILTGAFGLNPDLDPPAPSNSAFLLSRRGELLGRQDKRVLVPGAEILLTPSNEAWFGPRERDQHVQMSVVRSIETRLPLGRSTNMGLTCLIDQAGRIVGGLPRDEEGVLIANIPVTDATPAPAWMRRVPAGLALPTSLLLAVGAWRRVRRERHGQPGEQAGEQAGEQPGAEPPQGPPGAEPPQGPPGEQPSQGPPGGQPRGAAAGTTGGTAAAGTVGGTAAAGTAGRTSVARAAGVWAGRLLGSLSPGARRAPLSGKTDHGRVAAASPPAPGPAPAR